MVLNRLSLQLKIMLLTLVIVAPILAALELFLMPLIHSRILHERQDSTRFAVELAIKNVEHWQVRAENNEFSKADAQKHAIEDIKSLRYNEKEYFWIQDETAQIIMHPIKPELDGKNLSTMQDKNGKFIFKEFAAAVKNQQHAGSVDYLWPKPGQEEPAPKISFVKQVTGWNWIIGSGVYVDDVNAQVQSLRYKIWTTFLLISIFSLGISFRLSLTLNKQLGLVAEKLQKTGDEVITAVNQLSNVGHGLSSASTKTASSLEETVASLEELTSMVQNNSRSADEAALLSAESKTVVENGESELRALVVSMNQISSASRKIEQITEVIDDISFQTNLLSLNAAVEAAHAGEQGKGFAVVADAVRTLAQKSALAAKDISALIHETVEQIENGSKMANRSGGILADILKSTIRVAQINAEIAAASKEQASGISQISLAMNQIDQAAQHNAISAEEINNTSSEINNLAQTTKDLTAELETVVNGNKIEQPQNTI